MITQIEFSLPPKPRGFHLITDLVVRALPPLPPIGMLHLFLKHTSAGIALNENADPDVRADFESVFNELIPENNPILIHTIEGPDDMPAHVKSMLSGQELTIPISKGVLNLGTWQGIYLCEFRNHGGARKIVASILS